MRLSIVALTWVLTITTLAEESRPPILSQDQIGKNACGPCSFVNSLVQSGDEQSLALLKGSNAIEKAQSFGERFGGKQSIVYGPRRTAYTNEHGTADKDLLAMINQLRTERGASKLMGEYLLRNEKEASEDFSQRVRLMIEESLSAGFPPLLSVRSVKAEKEDEMPRVWNGIVGHWLCIIAIQKIDEDISVVRFADSRSGKVIAALLYTPSPRGCKVPMSFEVDEKGAEKWDWVEGDRCMFVSIPSLPLGTDKAKWYERTYIAARYLISNRSVEQGGADQSATGLESKSGDN